MAIFVEWYDETQTILMFRLQEKWEMKDVFESRLEGDKLMDTVNHPVYIFFDTSLGSVLPINPFRIARHSIPLPDHPNTCLPLFLICPQAVFRNIIHALQRIYPLFATRWVVVASIEQALQAIEKSPQSR